MPNLDAEVLNEPKKQIVKDFNKEEVVQIIQNAIDKRILDLGDIGGGSEVVANPTLAGTEPNLDGLEVDGEKYKIPEGAVVEANPTLAGTEDALTGLQVGDTKYSVGGGTKLYLHRFRCSSKTQTALVFNGATSSFTIEDRSNTLPTSYYAYILTNTSEPLTTIAKLYSLAQEGKVICAYLGPKNVAFRTIAAISITSYSCTLSISQNVNQSSTQTFEISQIFVGGIDYTTDTVTEL